MFAKNTGVQGVKVRSHEDFASNFPSYSLISTKIVPFYIKSKVESKVWKPNENLKCLRFFYRLSGENRDITITFFLYNMFH